MPLQVAHLRGSETVSVSDQDHRCIAMTMPTQLASSVHEPLDLALGEIAAFDCEVFDVGALRLAL
jgi:hypothetical protein